MKLSNFIAAMIAMLIGGPIAWEFFDRTPPYEVVSGVTVPPQIRHGQTYHLQWVLNPNPGLHCPGTVYRYIRDAKGTIWVNPPASAAFGLMPMQWKNVTVVGSEHTVPLDAATGRAEIYIRTAYYCNFTQYVWPLTVIFQPVITEITD